VTTWDDTSCEYLNSPLVMQISVNVSAQKLVKSIRVVIQHNIKSVPYKTQPKELIRRVYKNVVPPPLPRRNGLFHHLLSHLALVHCLDSVLLDTICMVIL
jgi:hypothetical protein